MKLQDDDVNTETNSSDVLSSCDQARVVLRAAVLSAESGQPVGEIPQVAEDADLIISELGVRDAFDRILVSRHADQGLEVLHVSGLLARLLPEVAALAGLGDYKERHKDVWEHTKQVVTQTVP
ncbi:MAG: hypothetical protein MK135_17810, partial [Polyangiaceae bacterium]|nr:hypothetical protein [Polyangiaceae bacterium]